MAYFLTYKMPDLSGPKYGCFAKIPRHPPDEGRRYFETTYYKSYSSRFDQSHFLPMNNQNYLLQKRAAGSTSDWNPVEKIKISTKLIAEKFNEEKEPKYNTEVQRTWINYKDPGMGGIYDYNIDNTKTIQLPKIDNNLSLPMFSEKEYSVQRSKSVYGCPKTFTDVTKNTIHVPNLRKY